MVMAAPQAEEVKQRISAIWENLQCPICLDLMSVPVTTKCDHQFCKFCMQNLLDRGRRQETNCPVCKTKVTKRSVQESSAFQKLVAGLQQLVEAYEFDTSTSYFTGLAKSRRPGSPEVWQNTDECVDIETPEHDGIHGADGSAPSMTSSRAAKDAFAQLMDLGDSCSATSDSGLGHLPQASRLGALCSPVQQGVDLPSPAKREDNLPVEGDSLPLLVEGGHDVSAASGAPQQTGVAEGAEPDRVVVHAKRQTRSSRVLVAKQQSGDSDEEVVLRRSSRSGKRRGLEVDRIMDDEPKNQKQNLEIRSSLGRRRSLEVDRIVDGRQRSLEKVSEWLLRIPPEGPSDKEEEQQSTDLRQDNQSEEEHSLRGSNSSWSIDSPTTVTNRPTNQREEGRRGLEERVFGAVYSRGRRTGGGQGKGRATPGRASTGLDQIHPDIGPTAMPAASTPGATLEDLKAQAQRGKPGRKRRSGSLTPADFIKRPCAVEGQEPNIAAVESAAQDPEEPRLEGSAHKPDVSGLNTHGSVPCEADPEPTLGLPPEKCPTGLPPEKSPTGLPPEKWPAETKGKSDERSLDRSAFEENVRTRGRRRAREKMEDAWTDLDKTLSSDAPEREPRPWDARGKRPQKKPDERKQPKAARTLELVSAGGKHCPLEAQVSRAQVRRAPACDADAQIESYPSSGGLSPAAAEVQWTNEVQGIPRRTRSMTAKAPTTGHTNLDHTNPGHTNPELSDPGQPEEDPSAVNANTRVNTPGHSPADGAEEQDASLRTGAVLATVPIECHINPERSVEEREQGDGTGVSRSPRNQPGPPPKRNGCVCEREMDSIEEMEVVEASALSDSREESSAAVVPHTQTPIPSPRPLPAVNPVNSGSMLDAVNSGSMLDAVVPHSKSPAEALVPFSLPGVSPQHSPAPLQRSPLQHSSAPLQHSPALLRRSPASAASVPAVAFQQEPPAALENRSRGPASPKVVEEEEEGNNDSELDTELLLKSFRGSKRKSFHLGSPRRQNESPAGATATETRPDTQPGTGPLGTGVNAGVFGAGSDVVQNYDAAAVLSCGSELIPPSDPGQGRHSAEVPLAGCPGSGSLAPAPQEACGGGNKEDSGERSPCWRKCNFPSPSGAHRGVLSAERAVPKPAPSLLEPQHTSEQGQSFESSMTPDGLVPLNTDCSVPLDAEGSVPLDAEGSVALDAESPDCVLLSTEAEGSAVEGGTDASQPLSAVRKRRGRKAQRLESSESELSSEDDELPSLQQIFRPKALPQPISNLGRRSVNPPALPLDPDGPEEEASDCEVIPCSLETPPPSRHCPPQAERGTAAAGEVREERAGPDEDHGAGPDDGAGPDEDQGAGPDEDHGSQDLFGTPEEDEGVPEVPAGETAEFSQYSSDIINTQQKAELHVELRRLEQMMALVSEALKQKEAEPCTKAVQGASAEAANGNQGAGPKSSSLRSPKKQLSSEPDRQQGMCMRHEGSAEAAEAGLPTPPPGGLGPTQPCNTQGQTQGQRDTQSSGDSQRSEVKGLPAGTPPRLRPLQLVLSGLSGPQQVEAKRFAKRMGSSVTPHVTSDTTHVIIRTDDELVCERTLKYFQGIAHRTWVVSYLWVSECLRQEKLLNEAEFEVCGDVVNGRSHHGPQKARCTQHSNLLMKGFEICFYGPFVGMSTGHMQEMVELCGGVVVEDLGHFSKNCSSQLVIVQPDSESETNFKFRDLPGGDLVVSRGWLLDSIATYTLQDVHSYRPELRPFSPDPSPPF
ncbi:breast cancer type 1 susceptibility protein homolog [Alosa alosa]|nr:breast cancer type 1 susceptibility protein homolog [Alosa alosa]